MNEEERRLEILKAEAAIRELAGRMAEAIECTRQAEMARSILETTVKSMDDLNAELQTLTESRRVAIEEESKSLNQARETLEIGVRDLKRAQERLENKAENLETSMEEKNQKFYESANARLDNLSQGIGTISSKLLFIIDQNEASKRRISAFQSIIEGLSCKIDGLENETASNSEEVHGLKTQVIESNERLSYLEYGFEAKISGLVNRLRSTIVRRLVWS